jgi:hypothetical protein
LWERATQNVAQEDKDIGRKAKEHKRWKEIKIQCTSRWSSKTER